MKIIETDKVQPSQLKPIEREWEDDVIPKVIGSLRYPVRLKHGRELVIPYGCKTGWNFGEYSSENLDGLKARIGKKLGWFTSDERGLVVAEINSGRRYIDIAEDWLVTEGTIARIAREENLQRRPRKASATELLDSP